MKKLYILLALLVLASCGEAEVTKETVDATPSQAATQEIETAIAELTEGEDTASSEEDASVDGIIDEVISIVEEDETLNETEADDVDDEKIDEVSTTGESNVVELSTTYVSPKGEVPMDVTYTLDSDNKITEISASTVEVAHEKHVINLNNGIQSVIGMTVEDASEYSVSGSSLATAAFQEVMKG